ncbi:hypothetical protein BGZ65_000298 [Modicella reniformis]|uniref:DNA mismatch repair protein S5 domain-containing protein n=1 Tax=Modicella reniformis TaxID=1440133 RepID=A0A9P6J2P3_9FUNG|nr:hypothetical protein BGZ65_000298 [Modicella reniformis]
MTKGTIVKISNLFEGMPVRRSELVKNIKREYSKCLGLIQAYGLISTNVRISCVSQVDKNGNASVRQNIINVFGPKAMVDVIELDLLLVKGDSGTSGSTSYSTSNNNNNKDMDNRAKEEEEEEEEQKGDIILKGYISSPAFGKGRSSTDRQYLFINGRPCVLLKVARVINEVYHSFNKNQSPFLVADLILPTSFHDVNVSPDKRTIFLHNEHMLMEELRSKLTALFEPSRSTFVVSEAKQQIKKQDLLASRLKTRLFESEGDPSPQDELEEDMEEEEEEGRGKLNGDHRRGNLEYHRSRTTTLPTPTIEHNTRPSLLSRD